MLEQFLQIPTNIVVIGQKKIAFGYARNTVDSKVTGFQSYQFKWSNLLTTLELLIKKHATINSTVYVYHTQKGLIGSLKKLGFKGWEPFGLI